jgi:hypothetical protein
MTETRTTVYRFKFSEEFLTILVEFSTIHQHDKPKDFKEAFETFEAENANEIAKESRLLINAGYDGNIIEKMYKSARYYFKNKDRSGNKNKNKRRVYIKQDKNFINIIDRHIEITYELKPSDAFDSFKTSNEKQFNNECVRIGEFLDKQKTHEKIKKTYKNRYFLKQSNLKQSNQKF